MEGAWPLQGRFCFSPSQGEELGICICSVSCPPFEAECKHEHSKRMKSASFKTDQKNFLRNPLHVDAGVVLNPICIAASDVWQSQLLSKVHYAFASHRYCCLWWGLEKELKLRSCKIAKWHFLSTAHSEVDRCRRGMPEQSVKEAQRNLREVSLRSFCNRHLFVSGANPSYCTI